MFIIGLVYTIIPLIVMFGGMFFLESNPMIAMLMMLIGTVLAIIFGLVATIGYIRFAKTDSLGEGSNFRAVLETIGEIGWGHYILSYILFLIVIGIISGILSMIPILGAILILILMPVFMIWQGTFFENLYSCA